MINRQFLVYDLGGTKVEVGVVDENGKLLTVEKELLDLNKGKDHTIDRLLALGQSLLRRYPSIERIGFSSCGPLNPFTGELLDPTNLISNGEGWGVVPLTKILSSELNVSVHLENDAACSALAEKWLGYGRDHPCENMMAITLGTGVGTGIICNGELFRGGNFSHPEAGHMIIQFEDCSRACACGVSGDVESYLSGKHFVDHYHKLHLDSKASAEQIIESARGGDPELRALFQNYAKTLAASLHNYCVMFAPEVVVFGGSFAQAFDLFGHQTLEYLRNLLKRRPALVPNLVVSQLQNHSCLLGAAYLCRTQKPLPTSVPMGEVQGSL